MAVAGFLTLFTLSENGDYFFDERAGVVLWLCLMLGVYFGKRYGYLAATLASYMACSSVWATLWRHNKFMALGLRDVALERACAVGMLSTVLTWFVVSQEIPSRKRMAQLLTAFGLYVCIHFWFLSPAFAPEGFLMTPTMTGVFLMLLFPVVFRESKILAVVFVVTGLQAGSETASACAIALAAGYGLVYIPRFTLKLGAFSAAMSAIWLYDHGIAAIAARSNLRFQIWTLAMTWWNQHPFHWLGMGAGTAYTLVPYIQDQTHTLSVRFTYLHNEFLQALFELGWVGLGLILCLATLTAYRAWKRRDAHGLAFLLALIPASATGFPFRHETFLVLTAFQLHALLTSNVNRFR